MVNELVHEAGHDLANLTVRQKRAAPLAPGARALRPNAATIALEGTDVDPDGETGAEVAKDGPVLANHDLLAKRITALAARTLVPTPVPVP